MIVKPLPESLAQAAGIAAPGQSAPGQSAPGQSAPVQPAPVHLWNPPLSGQIDITIDRDGNWHHEGRRFEREALARLFAGILKREGDAHFLVTPVEKWQITVEDAPFVAVDFEPDGDALIFTTNLGEKVAAGPGHEITVTEGAAGDPRPYIHVRDGLMARIDRKSFYRLAERAERRRLGGTDWLGVTSNGAFFPLAPAEPQ